MNELMLVIKTYKNLQSISGLALENYTDEVSAAGEIPLKVQLSVSR
tara:strand:- start:1043 stop:1180 length:138 start_codon:yes stop_codon:yes gene_type:complete